MANTSRSDGIVSIIVIIYSRRERDKLTLLNVSDKAFVLAKACIYICRRIIGHLYEILAESR